MGLGDDAQVAALIDEHLPDVTYFVTAETVWPLLSGTTRTQLRRGDRWDWLWTSTPPEAHPKQAQVKILTPQQERLVPDVMAVGYPDRWDGADPHLFDGPYGDYVWAKVGKVFPDLR